MTSRSSVEAAKGRLKVFPLPSVVLFPGAVLPLHIFEPRYRQLVKDALAGDGVMAMGHLEAGWEPHYQGRPPMEPLVCAGVIVWHQELPEGKYDLVLAGVARARVLAEHPPQQPYREVQAELLVDGPTDSALTVALQQAVLKLSSLVPEHVGGQLAKLAARHQGGALADAVAATIVQEMEDKLRLFRMVDAGARLSQALAVVGALVARLAQEEHGPRN